MTGGIMIDMTINNNREKVAHVQIISALTLEILSGMKTSNRWSPLKVVREHYGFKGARKPAALKHMVESLQKIDPGYVPSERTVKAIG